LRVALDTNLLVYAEGVNGQQRKVSALALLAALPSGSVAVPVQTLGELFQVLVRKANRSASQARLAILTWRDAFPLLDTSESTIVAAAELASVHRLGFWDAVILASASEGGCRLLLSEDLQAGFTWHGVTVANPFSPSRHPLLASLLQS
jgi:predicted nucleic acid-binding protein